MSFDCFKHIHNENYFKFHLDRPEFPSKVEKIVAPINSTKVKLTCKADANPTPKFKWSFEGRHVQHGHVHSDESSSTLTIQTTSSNVFGIYKCKASNSIGDSVKAFELKKEVIVEKKAVEDKKDKNNIQNGAKMILFNNFLACATIIIIMKEVTIYFH